MDCAIVRMNELTSAKIVLILVLMEDALALSFCIFSMASVISVLILVLMEDALAQSSGNLISERTPS